jgi:type VI secretion system protein ImpH
VRDLNEQLTHSPHAFGFHQAVSLLEEIARLGGAQSEPVLSGAVRFRSSTGTTFPASDIQAVESKAGVPTLRPSFMGLCGTVSPLPSSFVEHTLLEDPGAAPLGDFLAMFENRVYALFHLAWRARQLTDAGECAGAPLTGAVAALAGLTGPTHEVRGQSHLMACAGTLAGCPRSADGLAWLLTQRLGLPVEVQQRTARWVQVQGIRGLGRGAALGDNSLLGLRILDRCGSITITVGPVDRSAFTALRPGGALHTAAKATVQGFVQEPMAVIVEPVLAQPEAVPVSLGLVTAGLGHGLCLGPTPIPGTHSCDVGIALAA